MSNRFFGGILKIGPATSFLITFLTAKTTTGVFLHEITQNLSGILLRLQEESERLQNPHAAYWNTSLITAHIFNICLVYSIFIGIFVILKYENSIRVTTMPSRSMSFLMFNHM